MISSAPKRVAKANDHLVLKGINSALYSKAKLAINAKKMRKSDFSGLAADYVGYGPTKNENSVSMLLKLVSPDMAGIRAAGAGVA